MAIKSPIEFIKAIKMTFDLILIPVIHMHTQFEKLYQEK